MARRYDSSTTTFSPEGRLHQVSLPRAAAAVSLQNARVERWGLSWLFHRLLRIMLYLHTSYRHV